MFIKVTRKGKSLYVRGDLIAIISPGIDGHYIEMSGHDPVLVDETPEEILKLIKPKACTHAWGFDPRGFHLCIHCNQARLP